MNRNQLLTSLTLGFIFVAPAAFAADLVDVGTTYEEPAPPTVVRESVVERPVVVERRVEVARPVERRVVVERPIERRVIVDRPVERRILVEPRVERRVVVERRIAPPPSTEVVEHRVYVRHPVPPLPVGSVRIDDDAD